MIDKLTKRAREALLGLPQEESVTCGKVIKSLNAVGGMGGFLLETFPALVVAKKKKLPVDNLVKEAFFQSSKLGYTYVGTEHLLLALLKLSGSTDVDLVKDEIQRLNIFPSLLKPLLGASKLGDLDGIGQNLNQQFIRNYEKPLIERDEYQPLVSALLLKTSPNVLLVGDSGVGRDSLVKILAKNIVSLEIPSALAGYQIVEIDVLSFMTGLLNKGNVELGLRQLTESLQKSNRVILYLKNFQSVFYSTSAGLSMPVFYSMLISAVNSIGIKVVTVMNSSLYDRIALENDHLLSDFTIVEVLEPTEEKNKKILSVMAEYIGEKHNIKISSDVLDYILKSLKDVNCLVSFPKKGIDFIDYCCATALSKKSTIPSEYAKKVDKSFDLITDLEDLLEKGNYDTALKLKTKIDRYDTKLSMLEDSIFVSKDKIMLTVKDVDAALVNFGNKNSNTGGILDISEMPELYKKIKSRIIGQDKAVEVVSKSLIRSRLGLRAKKRPLGNFLFLGPTGVGKTEFAKVLAEEFYGNKSLIRLDMSDFAEKHNVARLVGAPPGYVGYGDGGELTSKIENNPHSVVLFDEIEKAHADVLNILLQITEEGELTDAKGQTYDFSQCVVVLTSNLGTEILHNSEIGFTESEKTDKKIEDRLKNNLKKILKPELLNRFDEIVVFKNLKKEDQLRVLDLLIHDVKAVMKSQDIHLTVRASVKKHLLKGGYSKEYGARALRRTMERELLDKIAEHLLSNQTRPIKLVATMDGDKITIQ